MFDLNELVDLAQRLDAVADDSDRHVLSMIFCFNGGIKVQMSLTGFISAFDSGDISERSGGNDWEVSTDIEGVVFKALFDKDDLHQLRGFAPDEWIDEQLYENPRKVLSIKKAHPHGYANEQVKNM